MTRRFSLVIPAYNEEAYLPQLLATVDRARAAFHGGPEAIEVIRGDVESVRDTEHGSGVGESMVRRVLWDARLDKGCGHDRGRRRQQD